MMTILLLSPLIAMAEPASLILEAERFQPAAGLSWKAISCGENYFWDAIGNGYFSGEKLLSAPEHGLPSDAGLTASVPRDGRYKLWVHYEAPKDYNTCFGVKVRVWAVRAGDLSHRTTEGAIEARAPLEVTDFLVLSKSAAARQ